MHTDFTSEHCVPHIIKPAEWCGCRCEECPGCADPVEVSHSMVVYSKLRKWNIEYITLRCGQCHSWEQAVDGKHHGLLVLNYKVGLIV